MLAYRRSTQLLAIASLRVTTTSLNWGRLHGDFDSQPETSQKARLTTSSSPECVSLLDWTLSDERHAIVVLCSPLPNSMPVNRYFHALHVILNIDDHPIVLADLNARPWDHSIGRQNTTLDSIGQHALAMTPHGVRGIWGAHLAGAVKGEDAIDFAMEF